MVAPAGAKGEQAGQYGRGPGHQQQDRADDDGGQQHAGQLVRGDQQAEHDEQADLGQPADAVGEGARGGAVRQDGVAEHEAGQVGGDEAGGVHEARRGEGDDAQADGGQRIEAGGGQGHVAQREGAGPAAGQPDRGARREFERDLPGDGERIAQIAGGGGEHQHQDDGGGVVEAGFGLHDARDAAGQGQHAQDGEDGGGVGGGDDRAQQQRQLQVHAEQVVRSGGRDHHADRDADRRQQGRRQQQPADVGPPGAQPAFDEDDGQRRGAESLGQLGVVEVDAEHVFAEQHAESQEQQQAGQAEPAGGACGGDAGEQHHPAGQ